MYFVIIFVGAGYVQIVNSSVSSEGSLGYSFVHGTNGTLILRNLAISLNFTAEAPSFLSAEVGLIATIDACVFSSMTTLSARPLIVQHQSTAMAVRVSIVNSSFTGLVVWSHCCSASCFL
jgi:hypothetical protein